jgi:hypothetical protein
LFVDAAERRGLAGFRLKRGWIRDVGNFTYTDCECISDSFGKWGCFGFRRVYWFVCDVRWVSGVVTWPNVNTNSLLVTCGDFEFRVSYEGVEGFIPPDEEPQVVDEFEG